MQLLSQGLRHQLCTLQLLDNSIIARWVYTINFPFKASPKNNSESLVALISECTKISRPCLALYLEWRLVIGAIFYAYSRSFFTASEISKKQSRGKYERDSSFVFQTLGDFGFRRTYNINQSPLASFAGAQLDAFFFYPTAQGEQIYWYCSW